MSQQRLILSVLGRRLAVELACVEEIVSLGAVTLLPKLPAAIPGVVDVRGRPIPLIDVGVTYGDPPRCDQRSVVVVSDGIRPMALLIDDVEKIEESDDTSAAEDVLPLDVRSILERIS